MEEVRDVIDVPGVHPFFQVFQIQLGEFVSVAGGARFIYAAEGAEMAEVAQEIALVVLVKPLVHFL